MANPQVENGYTRIANELMDALAGIRISGEARQVLDVVLRKTYGFQKKEDVISLSQFVLLTKMPKPRICHAINKLIEMRIIAKKGNDLANIYKINKDYSEWKSLPKKVTIAKKGNDHYQKRQKSLPIIGHTKERKKLLQKKEEIAPKAQVSKPSFNSLGVEIIKAFESVDPKNKTYYGNKTQRAACDFLLSEYGLDNVLKRISFLARSNRLPYFPKINSPNDLKEKWVKLEDAVSAKKAELNKNKIAFV